MQIAKMTDRGLASAARDYNRAINEGGEGYNPYRQEIDRRARAAEAARPKTREERIYSLMHALEIKDSSLAREAGLSSDQLAEIASIRAEIAQLRREEQCAFMLSWPREITIARREEWNNRVRAGEITTPTDLRRQEQCQGWTLDDLRRAVKVYDL